ncbi:MAG: ABC transporter ATP-binding protein [Gaiellales bacterium]
MTTYSGDPSPAPADPSSQRRSHLRRIGRLFLPYRGRLTAVLGLILVAALLGMVSPFLLREVLDVAIPDKNTALLTALVAGMVAITVLTGVIGVYQTLLSNQVGQHVMHDLRTAVFRHLQRLSLAFFTRTRTGEVQSRIASDIGGVENVVTSTATQIVSNVATVVASVVAMFVLDWRLAVLSLALLPLFVLLTQRVGRVRRRITTHRQETIADIGSLVQESLSVSGILLGKTMGRGAQLADRFEGESARLAELEIRQRMAGRWMMATIQMSFGIMPAAVYWLAGQPWIGSISIGTVVAFSTIQTRLFWPIQSLLTSRSTSRPRSRCSIGSSTTSISRSTSGSRRRRARSGPSRARWRCGESGSGTRAPGPERPLRTARSQERGRSRTCRSSCRRERRRRSSGRRAPGRRRSPIWRPGSTTRSAAR